MARVRVAVFSKDRYGHCRLCLSWLLKRTERLRPHLVKVYVYDDASKDPRLQEYLTELYDSGEITLHMVCSNIEGRNHTERGMRIALSRRQAAENFLNSSDDFLVCLDDDILVGERTIQEAVSDFEELAETSYARPGALTLHGLASHQALRYIGGKLFAELAYSGEANCIFKRDILGSVGVFFDAVPTGFGDTQFAAIREAGYCYYTRVLPYYQVQHLGFGKNASAIYKDGDPHPYWLDEPYTRIGLNGKPSLEPILVDGFLLKEYRELVEKHGERAPLEYLRRYLGEWYQTDTP